jgi:hypothetical protein
VSELWLPGASAAPADQFVERLLRQIAAYARDVGVERPVVVVELADTSRFTLDSISAEPGFGFVTLRVFPEEDGPEALIVPVGSLRRVELRRAADAELRFGFALPEPA